MRLFVLLPFSGHPPDKGDKTVKKSGTDFLKLYRQNDADGRFSLMMANYNAFPGIIKNAEIETKGKIFPILAERLVSLFK